jgi:RNA polymerase sigma factor (sigma-70 family)
MGMATKQASEFIQHVRRAMRLRDGSGLPDKQLLEDFIDHRDDSTMAVIVRRHGPLVWGVCRRILGNYHDAEDAFQATFLVLVRKAASIASRELLANWLFGVARQTALKARAMVAKRKGRERQMTEMPEPAATEQDIWRDLEPVLDQELSRLPDKYRSAILLCDMQGKTRKEVAQLLGCPEGTVASRLATARRMLAKRLAQRGVALSGGALASVVTKNVASAGVPTSVVSSTIKATTSFAAGRGAATGTISVKVAALTEGVLKAMLFNKLKTGSAVLLVIVLVGIGSGGVTALLAGDEGGRVGYQPPGMPPPVVASRIVSQPGEVALDANGGRGKPYFYSPPDPTNINHLWKLTKVGEYHMIESKLGELALDASGGRGTPYLRHSDPTNINHLWKLVKIDACYLLLPKVGDGELALDANGGKGSPCFSKADATNNNHLWEFRKTGDYCMMVPRVRASVNAPKKDQDLKKQLLELDERWWKGSVETLRKLAADDLISVSGVGRYDKASMLEAAKNRHPVDWTKRNVEVHLVNKDVAIVTYLYDCKIVLNNGTLVQNYRDRRLSMTWANRKGSWVVVFSHETIMPGGE